MNTLTNKKKSDLFLAFIIRFCAFITISTVIFLISYITITGVPNLKPSLFALHYTSDNVSVVPAFITTIYITIMALLLATPIGIFTAIYLVEYAKKDNKFTPIIRLTADTLSGIPSIVYGLFGMLFFVSFLDFKLSILSGALTLTIMILPLIIRSTEEALLSVDDSFREGAFGLGAGKLRTVFKVILPSAMPSILAGIILSIGRIVGETAALMYTAGTVAQIPSNIFSSGRTLSVHMYALSSEALHINEASATAFILLVLVIFINKISKTIAKKIA